MTPENKELLYQVVQKLNDFIETTDKFHVETMNHLDKIYDKLDNIEIRLGSIELKVSKCIDLSNLAIDKNKKNS